MLVLAGCLTKLGLPPRKRFRFRSRFPAVSHSSAICAHTISTPMGQAPESAVYLPFAYGSSLSAPSSVKTGKGDARTHHL